jgi:hypothetical protein
MRSITKSQLVRRKLSITVVAITVASFIFLFHKSSNGKSPAVSLTNLFVGPFKPAERGLIKNTQIINPSNDSASNRMEFNLLEDTVTRSPFITDSCTLGLNHKFLKIYTQNFIYQHIFFHKFHE